MAGSYGAGRFLPQDFSAYQAPDPFGMQQVQPAAPDMAYQPNYSLFWDPQAMLGLGNPQFSAPWYQSTPMLGQQAEQPMPQMLQPQPQQRQMPPMFFDDFEQANRGFAGRGLQWEPWFRNQLGMPRR